MTEYYYKEDVFSAAKRRIAYLFDEFDHIVIGFSGGKDSTAVLHLALQVAEEKGRLPVEVFFIDQEGEWDCTIDYVRKVMSDPRVKPAWLQIPMVLFNATATNGHDQWLHCWYEGEKWLRQKEDISIKENIYGTERFHELFAAYIDKTYPDKSVAFLSGVRCEESPKRKMNLTGAMNGKPVYKWIFWGRVSNAAMRHYTFYPIYDWDFRDVWKAIHDNGWAYNRLYDYQFQHGVKVRDMRVSNVHHETAIQNLWYMQEVEPDLWNRLTERLDGINTSAVLNKDLFEIKELPYMFKDWEEYRDYLLENLIADPERRAAFRKMWNAPVVRACRCCHKWYEDLMKVCVKQILKNDYEGTLFVNFYLNEATVDLRNYLKNGKIKEGCKPSKYTLAWIEQSRREKAEQKPMFVCMTTSFGGRDTSALKAAIPDLQFCVDTEGNAMKNFLRLITFSDGPLVLLEDDADLCDGFYQKALDAVKTCPDHIINFFSLRKKDYEIGKPFFERGAKFMMNQCYYLPAGYGQQIAEFYKDWPRKAEHPTGYDILMADWLKSRKEDYLQWFPHLVNHKVCKSLINPRRSSMRTDKNFKK